MAIRWALLRGALFLVVMTIVGSPLFVTVTKAQNVMRIRFDTVTVKPGDTSAAVNVYYTFDTTHGHDIQDVRVRMNYDTSLVYPDRYILDGTATSSFFDTTTSHLGILAYGQGPEMDLSDSVLLRIQFRVNPFLSDTAWIRWDLNFALASVMFGLPSDGVDSVVLEDGWIRGTNRSSVSSNLPASDVSDGSDFSIYPNPAIREVNISIPGGLQSGPFHVEVFDALGRLCWSGNITHSKWEIPSTLEPGTYFVTVPGRVAMYRTKLVLGPQ